MPHPLNVKIGALRRRVRRLLVVHGGSCTVAICVVAAAAAVGGDFLFRYEERGIRIASSIAVGLIVAWTLRRYLWPAIRFPLDGIFLARQIERNFPILRERLSGAIAFLNSPDDEPGAGSPQLRRTVIHETAQDALRLPLTDVVHRRPVVYAVVVATLVVVAVGALAASHREIALVGALRLLKPWGNDAWPQNNHLKFLNPVQRLAYGHRFRAELIDEHGAELPGDVTIQYRRGPDDREIERSVMRQEGNVWTAEKAKVTHDFAYRAIGGDDRSMPWIDVQVVEPAEIREVRWKIHYPRYADWKPLDTDWRPADQNVLTAALPAGSMLEIWARTNKPLRDAKLQLDGDETLIARLDSDKLGFSLTTAHGVAWQAAKSRSFRWELVGEDGFVGGDEIRRELLVEADPPPWVKLLKPQAAPEEPRGDVYVTPTAVVTAQVQTGDAFTVRPGTALRSVELRYNRSDRSAEGDQSIALHAGPAKLEPAAADPPANLREEEQRTLEYTWNLKPLELPPGTVVTLFAASSDYQPQERTSESRRLRVVSPDEFLERMNERQRALHAELNKLRNKQEAARQQVRDAAAQAEKQPAADPKAAETARRALQEAINLQRDVAAGLGLARRNEQTPSPAPTREGVQKRVTAMLDDLRANKIDNREVESRLTDIAAEMTQVEEQAKPQEIADRLAEALKANSQDAAERKEAEAALAEAGEKQDEVAAALDAMLRNLAQWDDYGKFLEELSRIKRDQEQTAAETVEHMRRQLKNDGKTGETAQQRQDAAAQKRDELAARQAAIARRFEQMQQNMKKQRDAGAQEGAEALDRAVRAAEEANPSAAMREAGQMLRDDQVGKAPERQQEALRKLGEVMKALSAQKLDELNRLVSKLRAAESDLDKLKQEQKSLKEKFRDAQDLPNEAQRKQELQRLAKQQRELQKKTQQLAEQLKRLKAERSAGRTSQGGDRMSGAGQAAEQGEGQTAEEQAAAAERDLDNAQRELAEERRQAEADLAREAAAKLEDDIKALIVRQQRVVDETKRYESLRQTNTLTRAAQIGILDLAEEQDTLEQETRASSERLGSAPAFKLALDRAAEQMALTSQGLRERRTDERTQRTAQNAVRRYQQLLDAIKPRNVKKPAGQQQEGQEGGGGGGGGGDGGDTPTSLAELVLIKLMQQDVNARTKELDELRKQSRLSPEEAAEVQQLGEEQGKLADLLLDLVGEQETAEIKPELEIKDLDLKKPNVKPEVKPDEGDGPKQPAAPGNGDRPSSTDLPAGATQ